MERKSSLSVHNPLSRLKESKQRAQAKVTRKKEIDDTRRERRRLQSEEVRQKTLEEKAKKKQELSFYSKSGERERRSWILGVGNITPTKDPSPSPPLKIDPKRRQYNKAMRKLAESQGWKASSSGESSNSTPEPKCNPVPVPHINHKDVYHSSQFQVSELIPPPKSDTVFCRICQSDEDSLENQLVTPCKCSGSLSYVHHLCLQQWRKTKKASGADITKCELCLSKYDIELLGKSDVKPDQTRKMQEDLRRLVRSGVYLMLLVDFCRDSFQNLLEERETVVNQSNTRPIEIHPPQRTASTNPQSSQSQRSDSSDDNEEYVSRAQLKRRSKQHQQIR